MWPTLQFKACAALAKMEWTWWFILTWIDRMLDAAKHDSLETAGAKTGFGSTDLLLLLMTVIWGSNFTAIKYSLEDILPLSFNALRFTIASIVMLIVGLLSQNVFKVSPGDPMKLFA